VPAGTFMAEPFGAGLFFVCPWDYPHHWFGKRFLHSRGGGEKRAKIAQVGMGSTIFHHET